MAKRIVVALGGNALGANLPEQMEAVKTTSKAIVDLIEEGNEVVVVHGNGPQVGMIANAMAELTRSNPQKYVPCPLSVCGAMSQGYIGYDLQNALREEMLDRKSREGWQCYEVGLFYCFHRGEPDEYEYKLNFSVLHIPHIFIF